MKKILIVLLILTIGTGFWVWNNKGEGKFEFNFETKEQIQKRKDLQMARTLQEYIQGQSGKYALKVTRLTTGESYGFNETASMAARSVIKVPIILTAVRLGKSDQYTDLLLRMGKNSDNNAQIKMEKNVGKEEIIKTLDMLQMTNTIYEDNATTAEDLTKMWKYINNSSNKAELKKYLTDSIYEDRITKGIPAGVELIHKVGTDVDVWNDSGIIECKSIREEGCKIRPFVLVILNEGVKREEAEKTLPVLTKMIWDYETSL